MPCRLIPMHCSASNEAFRTTNLCEAVMREERAFINDESIQGGLLKGLMQGQAGDRHCLAHARWLPLC